MSRSRILLILFFLLGSISIFVMSLHYFDDVESGVSYSAQIFNHLLKVHIVGGMLAIFTGPFQFIGKLRRSKAHKTLGYIYTLGVYIGSTTGVIIATQAMGGIVAKTGFFALAIVWFYCNTLGIKYAIQGDYTQHGKWMLRCFALTFSSITQRTMLLFAFLPIISFSTVYQISAWASWVFNLLLLAYFERRRTSIRRRHLSPVLELK
ncbi:MAG: DUF2306 domain-containing protein [Bacteroidota bacterium]